MPVIRTSPVVDEAQVRQPFEEHLQRDVQLGAGEVRAEAEVRAEPERHRRRRAGG